MEFFIDLARGGEPTNSTGGKPASAPRFVEAQTQVFTFKFLNAPAGFFTAEFWLTGSTEFKSGTPCFRAQGASDAESGTVAFAVDTYTEEYLAQVRLPGSAMWCDLTRKAADDARDVRVALLQCLADPRVYIPGVPPAPLSAYYTAAETDAKLAERVPMPVSGTSAGYVPTVTADGGIEYAEPQGGGAVQSVNGKVGAVVLSAGDVGALSVSGGTVVGNIQAENVNVTSGVNAGSVTGSTGAFNHLFLNDGADVTGDISVQGGVVTRGLKRKALSTLSAIPPENVVYTYALTAAATVSFGTPTAGYCPTFELWLTMPATAVAVTFPDGVLWDDGSGEFSASNPAPDLSAGSKVYHLVFRHDGTAWLGNLAYTKAVA